MHQHKHYTAIRLVSVARPVLRYVIDAIPKNSPRGMHRLATEHESEHERGELMKDHHIVVTCAAINKKQSTTYAYWTEHEGENTRKRFMNE